MVIIYLRVEVLQCQLSELYRNRRLSSLRQLYFSSKEGHVQSKTPDPTKVVLLMQEMSTDKLSLDEKSKRR